MNIGLPVGKELLTKSQKIFPLELRAKTNLGQIFFGLEKNKPLQQNGGVNPI